MLFSEILGKSLKKTLREEKLCKNILLKPSDELRLEVVRYLGYGSSSDVTPEIDLLIQKGMDEICTAAEPGAICRCFFPENSIDFPPLGSDSEKTCTSLHRCSGIILMGATLGISVDRLLNRTQIQSMVYALVLDSCATAFIESVCDSIQDDLTIAYADKNKYLTRRHSPGYGNLQLSSQPQLLSLLDAGRKIGLSVTRNFLLTPTKSVTAVIGVSDFHRKIEPVSCNVCEMRGKCHFRRREAS